MNGSFKFGTTHQYRPADLEQIGRLGDEQEANRWDIFHAEMGSDNNVKIGNNSFNGVEISGFENPIVYELTSNDFVSCASTGGFKQKRANELRSRELEHDTDNRLCRYITYDLKKLRAAITDIITEQLEFKSNLLIAQKIRYGIKDRRFSIGDGFQSKHEKGSAKSWLEINFIKSDIYAHEEEIRMLLMNPSNPGILDLDAPALILSDQRILDSIVTTGQF